MKERRSEGILIGYDGIRICLIEKERERGGGIHRKR